MKLGLSLLSLMLLIHQIYSYCVPKDLFDELQRCKPRKTNFHCDQWKLWPKTNITLLGKTCVKWKDAKSNAKYHDAVTKMVSARFMDTNFCTFSNDPKYIKPWCYVKVDRNQQELAAESCYDLCPPGYQPGFCLVERKTGAHKKCLMPAKKCPIYSQTDSQSSHPRTSVNGSISCLIWKSSSIRYDGIGQECKDNFCCNTNVRGRVAHHWCFLGAILPHNPDRWEFCYPPCDDIKCPHIDQKTYRSIHKWKYTHPYQIGDKHGRPGSTLSLDCASGYQHSADSQSGAKIECSTDGEWLHDGEPVSLHNWCRPTRFCTQIPQGVNIASISYDQARQTGTGDVLPHTVARVKCAQQYHDNMPRVNLICGGDGIWNIDPREKCKRKCPIIPTGDAYSVSYTPKVVAGETVPVSGSQAVPVSGSQAEITCNSIMHIEQTTQLAESAVVWCQSNGSWSSSAEALCNKLKQGIHCHNLVHEKGYIYGRWDKQSSVKHRSYRFQGELVCKPGYVDTRGPTSNRESGIPCLMHNQSWGNTPEGLCVADMKNLRKRIGLLFIVLSFLIQAGVVIFWYIRKRKLDRLRSRKALRTDAVSTNTTGYDTNIQPSVVRKRGP